MLKLIAQRLGILVTVVAAVAVGSFLLLELLPGDPTAAILGPDADAAAIAALRDTLRLDDPIHQRFGAWLGDVLRGDLGTSAVRNRPVSEIVARALPVSIQLMIMAQVLALVFAVPLAVAAARRPDGWLDRVTSTTALVLVAAPAFVIAILLIFIVSVRLGWLPATGYTRLTDDPRQNLRTTILPAIVLATGPFGIYFRILRADLMTTLQEDFVLLARAQGLSQRTILFRHALKPSALPLITTVGLNVGGLLAGAVIIEQLFALPGIGRMMVDAIFSRDYLVIQGGVLVIAVSFVVVNAVVDLLYLVLDPRTRHDS